MSEVKVGTKMHHVSTGDTGVLVGTTGGCYLIAREDGRLGTGPNGEWRAPIHEGVWVPAETPTTTEASWDYAEADRLRKAAADALAKYNAYAEHKPTTAHYPITVPWELKDA